jgi:hypothetical protein
VWLHGDTLISAHLQASAPAHAGTASGASKHHRLDLSKMSPRAQAIV